MNEIAKSFLDAYASGGEIEGGWKFAKALQQAQLDYSDKGLHRLDQLFAAMRERVKPSREDMQGSVQGRNFCALIAYHVIEVVRRRSGAHIDWHDRASATEALPAGVQLPNEAFARLIALAPDQGVAFMPLDWIEAEIFGDDQQSRAADYVTSLIQQLERNGPVVWWTGMQALGRTASWQMMIAADGGAVLPLMLRSTEPMSWRALMSGLPGENPEEALQYGVDCLEKNPHGTSWQVLAYDGFADLEDGRFDAVIVILYTYGKSPLQLKLAFPYRPAQAGRAFEILNPTLRGTNVEDEQVLMLGNAMQRGIQSVKWAFGTTWDQLRKA
ncbi:MAG: hypothetical protein HY254_07955 [Burkholderiales bacterium]|nr:hypothetical protein [Burkholderiales bacterium]